METLITTEYSHQYIYSDVLCYFLYVPEKMKIAMKKDGDNIEDNYYKRKLNFLQRNHFFDKEVITFQTDYTEDLVKQNMACLRQLLIEVTDKCISNANIVVMVSFILIMIGGKLVIRHLIMSKY